jgi:hypothetical protein
MEKVHPDSIDPAQIACSDRHPMAIQVLQNVDGYLTAASHAITELRGTEATAALHRRQPHGHFDDVCQGLAREEVIMCHLIHFAHATNELENPPNIPFSNPKQRRYVAHARRVKAVTAPEQRLYLQP